MDPLHNIKCKYCGNDNCRDELCIEVRCLQCLDIIPRGEGSIIIHEYMCSECFENIYNSIRKRYHINEPK